MALCPVPLNSRNFKAYYVAQTECDVLPANPVFTQIGTTGGSPQLTRDPLQSAVIDGSSEVTGVRLGSKVVNYEIAYELQYGVHDDLREFLFQSSWIAGNVLAGKTIVIDAISKTATIAGEDLTSDIAINDRIAMPSLTGGNKNPLLVTDISFSTDTVITFNSAKVANAQVGLVGLADETGTSDIRTSDKLYIGTERKLFAILVEYSDIDNANKYQLVMNCECTKSSDSPAVNAITTGTFTVVGKTLASAQPLPAGATLVPYDSYKSMTGIDGSITQEGERVMFSESMSFTLNRAGEPSYELGSDSMSFVDYGKTVNEVSITSKFVDFASALKFEQTEQSEVDYNFTAVYEGDCIGWTWPTAILTGVSPTVGEGTIPQELTLMPFKPQGALSSLVLHRVTNK